MPRKGRKFVTHTAKNGEPYFTLVAGNGEIVMTSETYSSKQAMDKTINGLAGKKLPTRIVINEK